MPPRVDRANRTSPERRALQDALAWPIVAVLLVGAGSVFVLPRFVPPRFVALAIGGAFALVTVALVTILARVVERWLLRHAHVMAQDAERQVQTLGVAGLPTATGESALIPLASAFADAGARAALRTAEKEAGDLLAQFGTHTSSALDRASAAVRTALAPVSAAPDLPAARAALTAIDACTAALRHVTAPVHAVLQATDIVAIVRDVVAALPASADEAQILSVLDTERGPVLIDRARIAAHLRELLTLARRATPASGSVTIHVSRLFRSNIEETPVRRTGDSRLTIVPRASGDALRTWVLRAQPGAEVLSIVITDASAAPTSDAQQHAFEPFALPRPGDPHGVTLAAIRRTVSAARGTIWIDGSREGGTAVHLLLPIAG